MSICFEDDLRAGLESTPVLKRRAKKILDLLDSKPSKKRTRRIAALERHFWAHLSSAGVMDTPWSDNIDWGAEAIDWAKWLPIILKILALILTLFM